MKWTATILFALAATLARADYPAGTTDSDMLRSGTPVVTNAWMAVSNETAQLVASSAVDPSMITDGTNAIDAAGNVYTIRGTGSEWRLVSGNPIFGSPVWQSEAGYYWPQPGWYVNIGENGWAGLSTDYYATTIRGALEGRFADEYIQSTNVWERSSTEIHKSSKLAQTNDIPSVVDADLTPATNYTDYAVVRLSQTNSVLSGGPYQTKLPYPTNAVPYSAISDAPQAVAVVAPSPNATAGSAADAKATGTALYTGFTEWEFSGVPSGYSATAVFVDSWVIFVTPAGSDVPDGFDTGATDEDALSISAIYGGQTISATRHLITPTKTAQLTNDGSNGVPFVVETQLGTKQDALPYPTNAVPFSVIVGAPSLAGQTFDFSRNYDIIRATADIVQLLGGTVTNNPTANIGGY